jgi:hypothetical protein
MKWLERNRMRFVLVGIVAGIIFGGGRAKADFTFGEPMNLGPIVNSSSSDLGPTTSSDGLSLYFDSDRPGGQGNSDIWMSTRATITDDWGDPVNLGSTINSSQDDWEACISSDGLELYFRSDRSGGYGVGDLWVAKRQSKDESWEIPVNLGPTVNGSTQEDSPSITGDGLNLFFTSLNRIGGVGGWDLWVTTRSSAVDPWQQPINLGPTVNSSSDDNVPFISLDGRILFFPSDRSNGFGAYDLYMTTRATLSDPWGEPVNLGSKVNTAYTEFSPSVSSDGLWLYFGDYENPRPGGHGREDLWRAPIFPIVDFNGDGIVDAGDMCVMVDHWDEDYSLCDIGPTPLGDGVVDVEDLKVLAEHLFEKVDDPTLVAHWTLDETEGMYATDSVGDNDAVVLDGIEWQPIGGQIEGALKLDGVSGYAITGEVMNPSDGPFSVIAWIKGGAPGQVVLSQTGAANWLCTDPVEGCLMTELKEAGRMGKSLLSQVCITDDSWHRIGFVWDGSKRMLYVDGVVVAQDMQDGLMSSSNGLYIGCGKGMEVGTYFSGLIDDVRIYNRVVSP